MHGLHTHQSTSRKAIYSTSISRKQKSQCGHGGDGPLRGVSRDCATPTRSAYNFILHVSRGGYDELRLSERRVIIIATRGTITVLYSHYLVINRVL
jgi:hypothetical protein